MSHIPKISKALHPPEISEMPSEAAACKATAESISEVASEAVSQHVDTAGGIDPRNFKFAVERLLQQISGQMQEALRQFYEPFGITVPQAIILLYIHRCRMGKITDVARHLHMSNSNLSAICRRLERDRLLIRTRDQKDQRIVWISLTDQCRNRLTEIEQSIDESYLSCLSHISSDDRETILKGLTLLNDLLSRDRLPDAGVVSDATAIIHNNERGLSL